MEIDTDRIDEVNPRHAPPCPHDRCWAWKGFDWDAMGRLHERLHLRPGRQGRTRRRRGSAIPDCPDEGARDGEARPIRVRGMSRGLLRVTVEPTGRNPLHGIAVLDRPGLDELGAGLEVELHAVDRAADAEALVAHGGAGREPDSTLRQGERIRVPLENLEPPAETGEERVRGALRVTSSVVQANSRAAPRMFSAP